MSARRVLVVDDSEVTRAILVRTLRGAGFEVLEARDGVEGALVALAERPAVVVTDLEMPTLDGFPLLRLLKADPASAHIPVLILSSHGEAASRFWSLRTGADAYLTKDYRPQQLVATVSRLADRAGIGEAGPGAVGGQAAVRQAGTATLAGSAAWTASAGGGTGGGGAGEGAAREGAGAPAAAGVPPGGPQPGREAAVVEGAAPPCGTELPAGDPAQTAGPGSPSEGGEEGEGGAEGESASAVAGEGEARGETPAAGVTSGGPAGALGVLARVARHLDAALLQATVINTLLERGMAAGDLDEACRAALQTVGEVIDARFLAVGMAEPDSATVQIILEEPLSEAAVVAIRDRLIGALEMPPGTPVEMKVSGVRGDVEIDLRFAAWVRLSVRGARGVLALAPRDPWQFAEVTGTLLDGLVGHLSLVLDNARLSQRLHELSTLDGLTRLLNRRVIFDRLREELERARRYRLPLSVVLCDLDQFKRVNDTHGHLAGDAVLREGAALLRRCLRTTDLLGRYGGEEFLAVLPQVDLDAALQAAERLRGEIEIYPVTLPSGVEVRVTASFGVASLAELAGKVSGDALITLADRRLYAAKEGGRNRVCP
ncbi:MAG TPA: diguanylate cyclase [Thermoanaerobaculia bacterium]|nr:diguanylate cyclase [Thermoanaerobaculia bacterium]